MSDMLSGSVLDVAPIAGDDFQSLMQLLPGVIRVRTAGCASRAGCPPRGAANQQRQPDRPLDGDFDLDLPGHSVESVEVLANPFAAEYGRFSTSVTQIRTRRGTNDWELKPGNLAPALPQGLRRHSQFEPRFSCAGRSSANRVFLAQDVQFRHVATPVKSLPGEPEVRLRSFDSFTRIDTVPLGPARAGRRDDRASRERSSTRP